MLALVSDIGCKPYGWVDEAGGKTPASAPSDLRYRPSGFNHHPVASQLHAFNRRFIGTGDETGRVQLGREGINHFPTDDGLAILVA